MNQSKENYLKTILLLERKNGYARVIDIAEELSVSRPSTSRAVSILKEMKYLTTVEHMIKLTAAGLKKADEVYRRHIVLVNFFIGIGVPESKATQIACSVEHCVDKQTYQLLEKHMMDTKRE